MGKIEFYDFTEDKYKHIDGFYEGLAAVKNAVGLWGYINKNGEEVIPCQYFDNLPFSNGLAAVKNAVGLWGYINKKGSLVIPYKFSNVNPFSEDFAAVKIASSWDWIYINKKGETVETSETFISAGKFTNGLACVKTKPNVFSYMNREGKLIGHYFYASDFENGYALVRKYIDGHFLIINTSFNVIASLDITDANIVASSLNNISNGLIEFKSFDSGRIGYLDKSFNTIIPDIINASAGFREKLTIGIIARKSIGIVNNDGTIKIFAKTSDYRQLKGFSEGLCAVCNNNNLWGYIDGDGKEVIPCQYLGASSFSEGLAGVTDENGSLKYIDKKGNIKIDLGKTYNSSIELEDRVIVINADSEEELNEKKLLVLDNVREYLISKATQQVAGELNDLQSRICDAEISKKAAK